MDSSSAPELTEPRVPEVGVPITASPEDRVCFHAVLPIGVRPWVLAKLARITWPMGLDWPLV
ncbi:hypothetical protein D3C81_2015610 [compost metagenome]